MFHYNYNSVVEKMILKAMSGSSLIGTFVGALQSTDPKHGKVRIQDALFGGTIGGCIGCVSGALLILAHPVVIISPLALIPYAYNKHKMETHFSSTELQ